MDMAKLFAPFGVGCCLLDGLKGMFAVEALDALDDGVGHDGYGRIAYHAVGLITPKMPYGEVALLVADVHQRHLCRLA